MKNRKWLVFGILGLVLAVGLTGCIISSSPDTNQIIEMKPGDKVIFKVVGPVNTPTTRCVWYISSNGDFNYDPVSVGKNEFELVFNPDTGLSNKKNIVTCGYEIWIPEKSCGQEGCYWFGRWAPVSGKEWEVRTNPNSTTVITGDYYIENVSDLELLKGYTTVTGSLIIGTDVESLEGLDKLTTIGGDLRISGNPYIKNLTCLKSLTSIGGLSITYTSLTNLSGLENITSFSGNLNIWGNNALTSLSGLENLTSISGDLDIGDVNGGNALTNLTGLDNLTSVGGNLYIVWNDTLTSLNGLDNMTSVGGNLSISGNDALTNLSGLENITSIGGYLEIYSNPALTNLSSLENITSVGGGLYIVENQALISLSGLNKLTSVDGGLSIYENSALTNLSGLENITSVGGDLSIWGNAALTSLSGLQNVISVGGDLSIGDSWYGVGNPALTTLGMTGLQRVGSDFLIIYNPMLCKSLAIELRNQVLLRKGIWGLITIKGNKVCTTP